MTDVMMLAKNFDPAQIKYPVQVTEKLDGVASFFHHILGDGGHSKVTAVSRQNKPIASVAHIEEWLQDRLPGECRVCGELTVDGVPSFKDACGIIRRDEGDDRIVLNVYDWLDYNKVHSTEHTYASRMSQMMAILEIMPVSRPVRVIPGGIARNLREIEILVKAIFQKNPKAEGAMIRPLEGERSLYKVGRSWGFMRIKAKPTIDVPITGFEEAVSEDGTLLGMVGRINVKLETVPKPVGIGPGKSTHAERKFMWEHQDLFIGHMCEVQYMEDDEYQALRQPTYQRMRPDLDIIKVQPSTSVH